MGTEFQNLDLGRILSTAEAIKGMRNDSITQKLQQQYMGKRNEAIDQDMQRQTQQDQVTFGAQKAKQVYIELQHVKQSQNPKNFIEQNIPDLAKHLTANGVDWNSLDDARVLQMVDGIMAKAGSEAGIGPAQPQYTRVKEGETLLGPDMKPAYTAPKSNEMTPYQVESLRVQRENAAASREGASATRDAAATNANFSRADKLRDEHTAQTKDFVAVGDAYSKVQAAAKDPSAAGDLALIFSFMKILDPGSVVREQEFANAQNATGVPGRIRASWNKALNGERLSPAQRDDFIAQAKQTYKSQETRAKVVSARYTKLANDLGVDPKYVVSDMSVPDPQAEQAQQSGRPPEIQSILDQYK